MLGLYTSATVTLVRWIEATVVGWTTVVGTSMVVDRQDDSCGNLNGG